MSLTSLIRDPAVVKLFQDMVRLPEPLPNLPLLAPPCGGNLQRVGTAFDYLLRFNLERLNPKARSSRWVAESAVERIASTTFDQVMDGYLDDPVYLRRNRLAKKYLKDAHAHHRKFIKTGALTEDVIVSVLRLAGLDVARRAGAAKVDWNSLEHVDPREMADIRALYELAQRVDFRVTKSCILNPTFNTASFLVGGADADAILDSTIIDFKVTQKLGFDRRDVYQLVGYYVLLLLDGVQAEPTRISFHDAVLYAETVSDIEEIAIYFARFGYLHRMQVVDVFPMDAVQTFVVRFVELACRVKRERLKYWRHFRGSLARSLREGVLAKGAPASTSRVSRGTSTGSRRGK